MNIVMFNFLTNIVHVLSPLPYMISSPKEGEQGECEVCKILHLHFVWKKKNKTVHCANSNCKESEKHCKRSELEKIM